MSPTLEEQDIAAANLQRSFAEYVQNPCTEKIDVLEFAIFVYDAIAAGLDLEAAVKEYEDYVAEAGNMTTQMVNAEILCGGRIDDIRAIPDHINDRAHTLMKRIGKQ
jgi:hypothetical protein